MHRQTKIWTYKYYGQGYFLNKAGFSLETSDSSIGSKVSENSGVLVSNITILYINYLNETNTIHHNQTINNNKFAAHMKQ